MDLDKLWRDLNAIYIEAVVGNFREFYSHDPLLEDDVLELTKMVKPRWDEMPIDYLHRLADIARLSR